MRVIRLEDNLNEAVLPECIQLNSDTFKSSPPMEAPQLTPKDEHDKAYSGSESNYREDGALKRLRPFG